MTPVTRQLAAFATSDHAIPDRVADIVRRAVVDTVGVAIAGAHEPAPALVRRALAPFADGPSWVLGSGERTSSQMAALLNATTAHALDFDDVCHAVKGHPSTVLVPVLLAVGEETKASGARLVEAFAVGVQVAAALWSGLGAEHYSKGWHATSTVGVVAAAAAAAHLYGADEKVAACALGIAASFAAGSRQNFGTMTKPLHAGHAAEWGVRAGRLAAEGFTADTTQIEADFGFFTLLGAGNLEAAIATLEGEWVLLGERGLNVKKYPCCYFAHRAIDAALTLPAVAPEDIESVHVVVPPGTTSALLYSHPRTGLEGKFSGEYSVAAALCDRQITLDTFTDAAVQRRHIAQLMECVVWTENDVPPIGHATWAEGYAVIELKEKSGATHSARIDIPHGDSRDPLTLDEVTGKFQMCVKFADQGIDVDELQNRLLGIHEVADVSGWSEPLARASRLSSSLTKSRHHGAAEQPMKGTKL